MDGIFRGLYEMAGGEYEMVEMMLLSAKTISFIRYKTVTVTAVTM